YPLSLHDALPILADLVDSGDEVVARCLVRDVCDFDPPRGEVHLGRYDARQVGELGFDLRDTGRAAELVGPENGLGDGGHWSSLRVVAGGSGPRPRSYG